MSDSSYCFLTCIQVSQEAGKVVFKNFPPFIVIHSVKGFGIVNKAEIDAFLGLSCFFDDPVDVGNLISSSSASSKSSLPEAGKDWRWEEMGMTQHEMVGWHHQLNGHGFGWTPGVGDGQEGLACCSPRGRKELNTTEQLNWNKKSELCRNNNLYWLFWDRSLASRTFY